MSLWSASIALVLGALLLAPVAGAAGPVKIVILPILVHSADPDASYVSRGIADMISARLEQTGGVATDRVDDPEAATSQLGPALSRGQARGGDFVIFGSFTQFGDGASLDVQCMPLGAGGESEAQASRRIFIQSGTVGEIIPKLDEIVDRLAAYVKGGNGGDGGPAGPGKAAPARAQAPAPSLPPDLAERLERLEEAVFGGETGGDATSAQVAEEPPPES